MGSSAVAANRGSSLVAGPRLLSTASSPVERGFQRTWPSAVPAPGLASCGPQAADHRLRSGGAHAQLLHSTWGLPGLGIEPRSPAPVHGFSAQISRTGAVSAEQADVLAAGFA